MDERLRKGWFPIWRTALEGRIWNHSSNLWQVWCWCLGKAVWDPRGQVVGIPTGRGRTVVKLERGQFLYGRRAAAERMPISELTIYRSMITLVKFGAIEQATGPHFTVVTICNFEFYRNACIPDIQASEQASIQATEQATDTKNKGRIKELEKEETVDPSDLPSGRKRPKPFQKPTLDEVGAYCAQRNNAVDAQSFLDFYESKGWVVGKAPMKDWKAAVRTWERNGYGNGPPAQRNGLLAQSSRVSRLKSPMEPEGP